MSLNNVSSITAGRPIIPAIKMDVVGTAHLQSHLIEDILPGALVGIRGSMTVSVLQASSVAF